MNIQILVDRVKDLRQQAGRSQEWVARRARINKRHLQRMESWKEETIQVRSRTGEALAKALNVSIEVLTGERELPAFSPAGSRTGDSKDVRQTTVRLDAQSTLNYDLIERRYGVKLQEVVNIAPLLFVIHAEQSLRRRKRVYKAKRNAVEQLSQLSASFPKLHSLIGAEDVDEWYEDSDQHLSELDSIGCNDLFAERVRFEFEGDGSPNPFVAHLDEVLETFDAPSLANIARFEGIPFDAVMYFPGDRLPEHEVCRSDLVELTGADPDAMLALKFGVVRVRDIPEDLMADDKLVERVTWLRAALHERNSASAPDADRQAVHPE